MIPLTHPLRLACILLGSVALAAADQISRCLAPDSAKAKCEINGGPPGDLYVEIHIKPHPVFERDGDDLHCQMPISFATAAIGGDIEVPTLGGRASFTVPEGTQAGKTFRLRGKGIKGVRSGYAGDLYVHINIETPVKLTEHQKELLKQFDKSVHEGGSRHSPQEQSWMDKVKNFFSS